MVEENPMTPLDPKSLLGGGGDKSQPGTPRKPEGGHGKKVMSKGHPVTVHDDSKNREGRTATESMRRNMLDKKRQEIEENTRLIKKREHEIRELELIQEYPEDSGLSRRNSRGDRLALVVHKKAPSQRRRSRSRSRSPTLRYERPDSDWKKNRPNKTKGLEDEAMTAREAARKALSNIASSPFARKLQEARLPSRVKHGTFILYETNADPVAHV
ncbi:uncharacterized protein LOC131303024 [Rhododendron vialii]|uniref:uncharacterized protein LOC131303024 n=1 Tax=Rhododendron vialii TaxID=182163 RepID=UPI00265D80CB|nr:uncharacterized protein LOC131303024 [Rhododendron vialii]